jgi:hypothetical protein
MEIQNSAEIVLSLHCWPSQGTRDREMWPIRYKVTCKPEEKRLTRTGHKGKIVPAFNYAPRHEDVWDSGDSFTILVSGQLHASAALLSWTGRFHPSTYV